MYLIHVCVPVRLNWTTWLPLKRYEIGLWSYWVELAHECEGGARSRWCAAWQWVSFGDCHQSDLSSLLRLCAVSVRVKMCLACWANFSAIKNGSLMNNVFVWNFLFQIRENVFKDFQNVKKKHLGKKPWGERKPVSGTNVLKFNWGQWTYNYSVSFYRSLCGPSLKVSKHSATVLSSYHLNITLTQSHLLSVNTQLQSCHVII